jgi:hypothetical protein
MLNPIAFSPETVRKTQPVICYCHIYGPGSGPPTPPCTCPTLGIGAGIAPV